MIYGTPDLWCFTTPQLLNIKNTAMELMLDDAQEHKLITLLVMSERAKIGMPETRRGGCHSGRKKINII